jgi:hypothetical protein
LFVRKERFGGGNIEKGCRCRACHRRTAPCTRTIPLRSVAVCGPFSASG